MLSGRRAGYLCSSTAALTQMVLKVLQRIDVMTPAQSGTGDEVVGCRMSSASDAAPETSEAEHERRCMNAPHGSTRGAQGPSQPTRFAGAQGQSPTEQRMARPNDPAGSPDWWETIEYLSQVLVRLTRVRVDCRWKGLVRLPQDLKFDGIDTKLPIWDKHVTLHANHCGLLHTFTLTLDI